MLLKQVMNMNTVLFLQSCPRQLEYNIVLLYKPLIENSQLIKLGLVAYIEISVFWNRWKISSTLSKLSWVFNVVSCMNIAWTFSVSLSVSLSFKHCSYFYQAIFTMTQFFNLDFSVTLTLPFLILFSVQIN